MVELTTPEPEEPERLPEFRPGVQVSNAVRQHCHVYFDEKLYFNALTLLSDIVTSSASQPQSRSKPVMIPAPEHLAVICSLLVHPEYTNAIATGRDRCVPALALTLLRDLLNIAGPVNANFAAAFAFPKSNTRASRLEVDYRDGPDTTPVSPKIQGAAAQHGLWKSAKDFWHIVGWAFNCSVCYPKRWRYWKVCLEFMLDMLQGDWKERKRSDEEDYKARKVNDSGAVLEYKLLQKSLLMQYLAQCEDVAGETKRVVKAAFADGSDDSLRSFPEIFLNEVKGSNPKGANKRKRGDFDEMPYAEYNSDSVIGSSPARSSPAPSHDSSVELGMNPYVDSEALQLRQWVLALFLRVAYSLPDMFTDVSRLYDLYWDIIKPKPVAIFSKFISPSESNALRSQALISISLLGCSRLLSHQATSSRRALKHHVGPITQETLEKFYLPYAANTSSVEDNAKLAVLFENLFRHIVKDCEYTPSLEGSIQHGIQARERQVTNAKRRKDGADRRDDDDAMMWMKAAGQRLMSMLHWLKTRSPSEVNAGD